MCARGAEVREAWGPGARTSQPRICLPNPERQTEHFLLCAHIKTESQDNISQYRTRGLLLGDDRKCSRLSLWLNGEGATNDTQTLPNMPFNWKSSPAMGGSQEA